MLYHPSSHSSVVALRGLSIWPPCAAARSLTSSYINAAGRMAEHRAGGRRAARTGAVARPNTRGLAHIDRLLGISREGVAIDRQARAGDLKLRRAQRSALLRARTR